MGLLLLPLAIQISDARPPRRSHRVRSEQTSVAPSSPGPATANLEPDGHRLLHPDGPLPPSWDGDWPEHDLDVHLDTRGAGPHLPPALTVRLCWCAELHRTTTALPGAGLGDAAEDTDGTD